ncbi:caspase family protein [Streptomyces sp. NPDC050392]|uniref:caspase family protein n=1 Tax=Streptomyces sp. NPDC050392 TaxID=3155782 RepID=UPI00341A0B39
MSLPDREGSRAVLIGIDSYRNLSDLKPVRQGLLRLAEILKSPPSWELAQSSIAVLDSRASASDVLAAIKQASLEATDALLVYFAGHGLRDSGAQQLYLALNEADRDHPIIGGIKYEDVKIALHAGSRAKCRVVILDCCFSGLAGAMGGEQSDSVPISDLAEVGIEGSYVLTSAAASRRSLAIDGDDYPKFTGELISLVEAGISGAGPTLTLDRLWQVARGRMATRDLPTPQRFSQNTAGSLSIAKNLAYSPHEVIDHPTEESQKSAAAFGRLIALQNPSAASTLPSGPRASRTGIYDERNPSWLTPKVFKLEDALDPTVASKLHRDLIDRTAAPGRMSELVVRYLHLSSSDPGRFIADLIWALDKLAEALVEAGKAAEGVAAKREANRMRKSSQREI